MGIAQLVGVGLGDDHDVDRWLDIGTTEAEYLAYHTLYSIPHNSVPNSLARGDAEPGYTSGGGILDHHQVLRMATAPQSLQAEEFPASSDAGCLGEVAGPRHCLYPGCFGGIETVRRRRPLARRRLSTWRPPGVAIRARKPCVRFRRRLLGW